MPQASGGWVNLSDYMAANKGAGEEMSAAGSAEVEKRRREASQQLAGVTRQARASGRAGGSTDLSQQAGYADYAKAQAGVLGAGQLSAGGSGNIWDAAIASPSWTANKDAAGAYSALQSQLSSGQRGAEQFASKGQDWNKPAPVAAAPVFSGGQVDDQQTVLQGAAEPAPSATTEAQDATPWWEKIWQGLTRVDENAGRGR